MSPQPIHIKMDFKTIHNSDNPVSLVSYQKIDGFTSKSQKPWEISLIQKEIKISLKGKRRKPTFFRNLRA